LGAALPTCAGPTELCFFDPRCINAGIDPHGGLGCNAGGKAQYCRFCGYDGSIPCDPPGGMEPSSVLTALAATWTKQLMEVLGCHAPGCVADFLEPLAPSAFGMARRARRSLQAAPETVEYTATLRFWITHNPAIISEQIVQTLGGWFNSTAAANATNATNATAFSLADALNLVGVTSAAMLTPPGSSIATVSPSPPPLSPPNAPPSPPPSPSPPPPKPPPPPSPPACSQIQAAGTCTGNPLELCYFDARCDPLSQAKDPWGGRGCAAGGVSPLCRFCGFGSYADIPCPTDAASLSALDGASSAAALSSDGKEGAASSPLAVIIASAVVVAFAIVAWRRRRMSKRRAAAADAKAQAEKARESYSAFEPADGGKDDDDKDSKGKGDEGEAGLSPEMSAERSQLRAALGGSAEIVEWSRVRFERMLDTGAIGKCYRVQVSKSSPSGGNGHVTLPSPKTMVLRRLGVDVLNVCTKLEWADYLAEAQALAKASPMLLAPLGVATDSGHNFGLLLEHASGSLERLIEKAEAHEDLASKLYAGWARLAGALASGLSALHMMGAPHLALHPGNVMLDSQMRVKITDYGLPIHVLLEKRQLGEANADSAEHVDEHRLYAAPEMLCAEVGVVDLSAMNRFELAPADLWSLGCMLVRLLTLEPPYASARPADGQAVALAADDSFGASMSVPQQLIPLIAGGNLDPADGIEDALRPWRPTEAAAPPHAVAIIRKCTAYEPSERPTPAEVFETLQRELRPNASRKSVAAPAAHVKAARLPAPQGAPRDAMSDALGRDSVADELGTSGGVRGAITDALGRDSVADELGTSGGVRGAIANALGRDSVASQLGDGVHGAVANALGRDSVASELGTGDGDARWSSASGRESLGRASAARPERLKARLQRKAEKEREAAEAEEDERMSAATTAGRAVVPRLQSRRNKTAAVSGEDDDDETAYDDRASGATAGLAIAPRLQSRRNVAAAAAALQQQTQDNDDDETACDGRVSSTAAGRAHAPRLKARMKAKAQAEGGQAAAAELQHETEAEDRVSDVNSGRAVPARVAKRAGDRAPRNPEERPSFAAGRSVPPRRLGGKRRDGGVVVLGMPTRAGGAEGTLEAEPLSPSSSPRGGAGIGSSGSAGRALPTRLGPRSPKGGVAGSKATEPPAQLTDEPIVSARVRI
jgi:serine/threonine protein kinase